MIAPVFSVRNAPVKNQRNPQLCTKSSAPRGCVLRAAVQLGKRPVIAGGAVSASIVREDPGNRLDIKSCDLRASVSIASDRSKIQRRAAVCAQKKKTALVARDGRP